MARAGQAPTGILVARRAVIRWALRLFRAEWRQQILVLGLVTVAVTSAVAVSSVAYGRASSRDWEFGDANLIVRISSPDRPAALDASVESARDWFGVVEAIGHSFVQLPGWDGALDVRAQENDGVYSSPMLDVLDGGYPSGEGEIALTDAVATLMRADLGDEVELGDRTWRLVGLVENPGDLDDEFAVVSPEHAPALNDVEILVDSDPDRVRAWPQDQDGPTAASISERGGTSDKSAAAGLLLMIEAVVLLLVALVSASGFVVMAHRRQRQLGLLAATGATPKHMRLVMLANGVAVGMTAALTGTVLGLVVWFAVRSRVEESAGHRIDGYDLPWLVILGGGFLAIVATAGAAWWPARAVARLPVTAALSGRPPEPRRTRHTALPGAVLLLAGAAAIVWANPYRYLARGSNPARELAIMAGAVAISIGVLLICPLAVRLAAVGSRRLPVAPRLALRDLVRHRARSSAALAAIGLAVGIPIATVLLAETSDKQDDEGNLSDRQLLVSIVDVQASFVDPGVESGLDDLQARLDELASDLDDPTVLLLQKPWDPAVPPEPGFEDQRWSVNVGVPIPEGYEDKPMYVATPEVLAHYGVEEADLRPGTQLLTNLRGELVFTGMHDTGDTQLAVTRIERLDASSYSSEPQTLITEQTIRDRGWNVAPVGWFMEASHPFSSEELAAARETAAGLGLVVQARRDYSNPDMRTVSITAGMALALAIVALTVGLVRSESTDELRTLAATGASSRIRRSLTAATAGALGLLGVLVGGLGAYVGLVAGYAREPQYLRRVPVAELLLIGVGMPVLAAIAGWLLGGREPRSLLRPRMPLACTVALVALVGTLGACGDDDGNGENGGRTDPAERAPLPMQEWEDAIVGTGEDRLALERQFEQHLVDCMAAQGFEYTPVEPHPGAVPDPSGNSPWSLPTGEFAERYGYGLFTIDEPGLSDPNAAREATMSESERIAYLTALEGPADGEVSGPAPTGGDSADEPEPAEPEQGQFAPSCQDQALAEVFGSSQVAEEDLAAFGEAMDALTDEVESDPRMEEAAREWAACMADEDRDYDVEHPRDAVDLVLRRFFELVAEATGDDSIGLESIDVAGQDRMVYRVTGIDVSSLDPQLLDTLSSYEIEVATADHDCRTNYDDVRYEVRLEYEEEFVREHRAELERFRDAVAAGASSGSD